MKGLKTVEAGLEVDMSSCTLNLFCQVFIGERAKRARHSQVCSIENRGYIYIYICICYSTVRSDIRDIFHEL